MTPSVILRNIREAVFLSPPQQMGVSDVVYYRHACEAVIVVEALEHGRKALEQLRELVQATLAGEHDPEPLLQPLFL